MRILLKDLRISPLRSFLTGFSMLIGIIAVIVSVLVGTIGSSYLTATNEQLFGRNPTYSIQFESELMTEYTAIDKVMNRFDSLNQTVALTLAPVTDISYTHSFPSATADQNDLSLTVGIEKLNSYSSVEAIYTTEQYAKVFILPIVTGRWLRDANNLTSLEMVVNQAASQDFRVGEISYASTHKTVSSVPIKVVGVVNDGRPDPQIYVNVLGIARYAPNIWSSAHGIMYWLNYREYSIMALSSFVSDMLFDLGAGTVNNVTRHDITGSYAGVISALQWGFGCCAVLLLFVSAIGLLNIGLASLEQRSHELLIRRAMGAGRISIASLVLGGTFFLAMCVSAIALLLSYIVVQLIPLLLPPYSPVSPPDFPYTAALLAIIAALSTALFGSFVPAFKAARLQPALALR